MAGDLVADDRAAARQEGDRPRRQVRVGDGVHEHRAAHRRARRGSPHDRVARRQRGRDDLRRHRVRPVPRSNDRDHAKRAALDEDPGSGQPAGRDRAVQAQHVLGRVAPVADQVIDFRVGLGVQRLALVEGERPGQLVPTPLAGISDPVQGARPLEGRGGCPPAERGGGGLDRGARVGAVALGYVPDQLTGHRAGGRLVLARSRGLPATAHEQVHGARWLQGHRGPFLRS